MNIAPDNSEDAAGSNPYAAPRTEVADPPAVPDEQFYVVGKLKFFALFFATLGLYHLYWFYRHWQLYRLASNADLWPVPRAIFSIFFTHSLTANIDRALDVAAPGHRWNPGGIALAWVVLSLLSNGLDRAAGRGYGSPTTDLLSLLMLPLLGLVLWRIQRAANLACNDAGGATNNRFTGANIGWIVAGAILWMLTLVGMLATETEAQ